MEIVTTLEQLADRGFVLQAVFDVAELPTWITDPIRDAGVDPNRFQRLVMLGQAGPTLWETIERDGYAGADPFDDCSRQAVAELVESLGQPVCEVVYPSSVMLPLGRMAAHAGWGDPSPLGLTINDEYGLWLAHRIVFLIDAPLTPERSSSDRPCDTCSDTPCVGACPVGAVSAESGFDVVACSEYRIRDGSPCADRCLARLACPIGTEHAYGPGQMAHHYAAGLASIRRWHRTAHPSRSGPE